MAQRIDPNEQHQRQKDQVEHQSTTQVAADRARSSGIDPTELMSREWMDTINELDVGRDLPDDHPAQHNLEKKLGAHQSKQLGIGFLTREEYEEETLKDRGRRRLENTGYRTRGGSGSKCKGRTRERMTSGESDERPVMDSDLSGQMDAGFEAKRMLRSGSVGGRRFKGSTEVQVVNKNEGSSDFDSNSGGMLSKVTGGLFG